MIDDHPSTILGVKTAVNQTNDMEFYNGYATLPEFYENVYGPSRKAVIYPVDVVLLDLRLADSSNPYDNTIALIKLGFKVLNLLLPGIPLPIPKRPRRRGARAL